MTIRRVLLAATLAWLLSTPAWAQGIDGLRVMGLREMYPSFAMTGVEGSYAVPVWNTPVTSSTASRTFGQGAGDDEPVPDLVVAVAGAAGFAKVDDEMTFNMAGGVRLGHIIDRNWGLYGDVMLGFVRFPGATHFTLRPGAGVIKPIPNKPFSVVLGAVFPSIFFSPFRETGYGFQGGLAFLLNK
jgi:hypothetical protein